MRDPVSVQLNSHLNLRGFGLWELFIELHSMHHSICCLFSLFNNSFWVWHPGRITNRCFLAFPRILKISLHFCNICLICKLNQLFLTAVVDCFSLFPDWYMNLPLSFTWKYLRFLAILYIAQCTFFPLIICLVECNRAFVCLPNLHHLSACNSMKYFLLEMFMSGNAPALLNCMCKDSPGNGGTAETGGC